MNLKSHRNYVSLISLLLGSLVFSARAFSQIQVIQNAQMQNWIWVNDTSWQRFVFSDTFLLTDIGYDNRDANPFTLSVYKNGAKYQEVSFGLNSSAQWAFTSLGSSAIKVNAGDVVDIVGAGTSQYVGVQSTFSSQVDGISSVGFWFNTANQYQYSGAGVLQPYSFANIKVQKEPSFGVPEPNATLLFMAMIGCVCVLLGYQRLRRIW